VEIVIKNKVCFIDDEDLEFFSQHKWYIGPHGYLYDSHGTLFHRAILDASPSQYVDHINRNRLDNRQCNLRICTAQENTFNKLAQSNNKLGTKGVHTSHNKSKPYRAMISIKGKSYHIGYYATLEEAAEARKKASISIHGPFAGELR
jgi:hypothetical protein